MFFYAQDTSTSRSSARRTTRFKKTRPATTSTDAIFRLNRSSFQAKDRDGAMMRVQTGQQTFYGRTAAAARVPRGRHHL